MIGIETVRAATETAASRLTARPDKQAPFLEASLRDELVSALGGRREQRIRIQGWSQTLGGVDVFVPGIDAPGLAPDESTGIETKVWSIDQVLYDMLKLAAICQQGDLGIGYVVVAARHRDWAADFARHGVISQMSEVHGPCSWDTSQAISAEGDHWYRMVQTTNIKPAWVPARMETQSVAPVEISAAPDHEIRIIRVRHLGDSRLTLDERGHITTS
jgi:hypothetical protein